jgi:DNA-binding NtrC family response regulator
VAVDCGALPPDLVEGLLFGQRKGAFTGANEDKAGLLEQADGGTVFLDEVGNLPLDAQTKLLRVLQTRENWRLGDTAPRPLDLRVLAATNSDLEDQAQAGRFRLDLYHRLCDFPLRVPPLRERTGDAVLLARLFLNRHRVRFHLPPVKLADDVAARLRDYPWPGNVRQLENAMKQTAVLAEAEVSLEHLPQDVLSYVAPLQRPVEVQVPRFKAPEGLMPLWKAEKLVRAEVESRLLGEAMAECGGDAAEASKRLGLHPKTLARKLKEYRQA